MGFSVKVNMEKKTSAEQFNDKCEVSRATVQALYLLEEACLYVDRVDNWLIPLYIIENIFEHVLEIQRVIFHVAHVINRLYHCFLLIQVTVWDLNRYGPNDFLGEVLLDLDNIMMNHEPNWYTLKPHEETASFSVSIYCYTTYRSFCITARFCTALVIKRYLCTVWSCVAWWFSKKLDSF